MALLLLNHWVSRAQDLFMLGRNVSAEPTVLPTVLKILEQQKKEKKYVLKEMLRKSKAFLNPNFLCYFLLLSLHAASVCTDSSLHSQLHLVTAEESGPTNTLLLAAGKKIS